MIFRDKILVRINITYCNKRFTAHFSRINSILLLQILCLQSGLLKNRRNFNFISCYMAVFSRNFAFWKKAFYFGTRCCLSEHTRWPLWCPKRQSYPSANKEIHNFSFVAKFEVTFPKQKSLVFFFKACRSSTVARKSSSRREYLRRQLFHRNGQSVGVLDLL